MIKMPDARGGILIMTLVFTTMFLVIFVALINMTSLQYHGSVIQAQDERAFHIAEAGLNYGRWRLSHNPDFFDSEVREFHDQQAGKLGHYEVSFEPPQEGGTIITITSTGYTEAKPDRQIVLRARYGMRSLARYALITNSDVWYSGQVQGSIHANGGIRMDGTATGLVRSAKETYICQPVHGCNNEVKPGVWGEGDNQELWDFPAPAVDYSALTSDLLDMKSIAEENNTYYGPSGVYGYSIVFNDNNTYSIYQVTQKKGNVRSWDYDTGWENTSHDINKRELIETKDVPSGGVIFIEDTLWIEGEIRDRVTVAAGVFPDTPATNVDIILNDSITYGEVYDGSRSLAAIAQRHVLIPFFAAPDDMRLDGAFVAQKGKFGRRHYNSGANQLKNKLDRYGMIASNAVPGTVWTNSSGEITSGYKEGTAVYDSNFLYNPPPHFPSSGQYEFISWEQVQ